MSPWTPELENRVTEMWKQGRSASQIATELGGFSRNAVIGKLHRMGLEGRSDRKVAAARKPERVKVTPRTTARTALIRPQMPVPKFPPVLDHEHDMPEFGKGDRTDLSRFRIPECEPVTFLHAISSGGLCKWPLQKMDEKCGPDTPCCGADTEMGKYGWKPFCKVHTLLSRRKVEVKPA